MAKKPGKKICAICRRGEDRIKKFIRHHLSYEQEIVCTLCYYCHSRLHGTARCFGDPLVVRYGKDKAPLEFSKRVVRVYKKGGIE